MSLEDMDDLMKWLESQAGHRPGFQTLNRVRAIDLLQKVKECLSKGDEAEAIYLITQAINDVELPKIYGKDIGSMLSEGMKDEHP